jgi:hypothetical protein
MIEDCAYDVAHDLFGCLFIGRMLGDELHETLDTELLVPGQMSLYYPVSVEEHSVTGLEPFGRHRRLTDGAGDRGQAQRHSRFALQFPNNRPTAYQDRWRYTTTSVAPNVLAHRFDDVRNRRRVSFLRCSKGGAEIEGRHASRRYTARPTSRTRNCATRPRTSGPDVLLGDRAVAPPGDRHHASTPLELADHAGPLPGSELDRGAR